MTVPLFGGRRAIRVRAGSRSFASGVDTLADMPLKDCRIVIEAGELRPESPLRKACERAKTAVAIGCYPDGERDLAKLIDDELRLSQSAHRAGRARGADGVARRRPPGLAQRIAKLALYAHGKGEVTLDDVMAVVADASELKIDPIVDGAFAGKPELVETEFAKAMVAGTYPGDDHFRGPAPGGVAAQIGARGGRGHAGLDIARQRLSAPAFFAKGRMSKPRCAISTRRGW